MMAPRLCCPILKTKSEPARDGARYPIKLQLRPGFEAATPFATESSFLLKGVLKEQRMVSSGDLKCAHRTGHRQQAGS